MLVVFQLDINKQTIGITTMAGTQSKGMVSSDWCISRLMLVVFHRFDKRGLGESSHEILHFFWVRLTVYLRTTCLCTHLTIDI